MTPELSILLEDAGVWAYLVAPVIMAGVSVLPFPAEAPALLNGALFGPLVGTVITWAGAMIGAWASFELSRAYGRPFVERWVSASALGRVDRAVDGVGWWGLLTLRLIPVVAFTALNWSLGLSPVPRSRFLWTTAVGILPGALMFTGSGSWLAVIWRDRGPAMAIVVFAALGGVALVWLWYRRKSAERWQ